MSAQIKTRDYSIVGEETSKAKAKGLVNAEWYQSPISRETLKQLMKRKDGPAIRDTIIWFVFLVGLGYLAVLSWGTWWMIPAYFIYGNYYMTTMASRLHETVHGTPFKTDWMNNVLLQVVSFFGMTQATNWKWSHPRHHTDTIIVGRDNEIVAKRPPMIRNFIPIGSVWLSLKFSFQRAFGPVSDSEKDYIPEEHQHRLKWESRVNLLILFAIWGIAIATQQYAIIFLFVFPSIYGNLINGLLVVTQHIGLHEDVLDHRLNTRTFLAGPIIRFLYWNMNYHVEHHMFPQVPYYNLPKLHEALKADFPEPNPSFLSAVKEVFSAMWKQRKDPHFTVKKPLPSTANPYRI